MVAYGLSANESPSDNRVVTINRSKQFCFRSPNAGACNLQHLLCCLGAWPVDDNKGNATHDDTTACKSANHLDILLEEVSHVLMATAEACGPVKHPTEKAHGKLPSW